MTTPIYEPTLELIREFDCVFIGPYTDPKWGYSEIVLDPANQSMFMVVSDSSHDTTVFLKS